MAAITATCSAAPVASLALPLKGSDSLVGRPVKLALNPRTRSRTTVFQYKVRATLEVPRTSSSDAALAALNEQMEMSKRQIVTALLISAAGVVLPCCQGAQSARAEPTPVKAVTQAPARTEAPPSSGYPSGYMPIKGPCCE
eukprot:TRINITY_DN2158_c1_g2_i2.p1 TRINITY_DN2158_c1_g2~~TRINITY_DN2158_c1_g2_i2.p1  ORF type:complete len:141 (-),score=22.37 TRINITY_DN2158_c1_g2_i2:1-423(-)